MDLINQDALKDLIRSIIKEELDKTKAPEPPKPVEPTAETVSNAQPDFDAPEIASPTPPHTNKVLDTFAPTTPPPIQAKPTSSVPSLNEAPPQLASQPDNNQNATQSPATSTLSQPPVTPSPAGSVIDTSSTTPPATPDQNSQPIANPNPAPGVDNPASVLDMPIG